MTSDRRAEIANRAYLVWVSEGRPEGKAVEHWLRAEADVDAQGESVPAGPAEIPAEAKPAPARTKRSAKR